MTRLALVLLTSLTIVPTAVAQDALPGVLVQDPKGDASLFLTVPLPAGADAWDLVEISVADETPETVQLRLQVAAVSGEPPLGEIGVHFRAGDAWWIVGWTTIAFPAPPFVYRGGFYCPSDSGRHVDPSQCDGFKAQIKGNAYVITMDRATLGALERGLVIENARGYADVYNSDGPVVRVDETTVGVPYVLTTGKAGNQTAGNLSAPAPTMVAEAGPGPAEAGPMESAVARGTSAGAGPLLAVAFVGLWVARRARR